MFVLFAFTLRYVPLGPRLSSFNAVVQFDQAQLKLVPLLCTLAYGGLIIFLIAKRRLDGLERCFSKISALVLVSVFLAVTHPLGHLWLISVSGAFVVGMVALFFNRDYQFSFPRSPTLRALIPWSIFLGVCILNAVYSMHRHWSFGSGSWDLGCMAHNFHLASRGLSPVSTVLGGVSFLADHFMPGIYLLSPFFWVWDSTWMVLILQSASIAVVAPVVYSVACDRGANSILAATLGLATGLAFGHQSAAYYDAHAITIGLGFLAGALWAIEKDKLRLATGLLVVFSLFKESACAYVVGLSFFMIWQGLMTKNRAELRYGLGWALYGILGFIVITRVAMPAFAVAGQPPVSHETFIDFGPTIFSAFVAMLLDPLKVLGALFIPIEKTLALGVTVAGTGWLALLAPEIGIAALPLFAERFLSSKASMWQMGYHYAAPLTLYAGWAAARAVPKAESLVAWTLGSFGGHAEELVTARERANQTWLALYIIVVAIGVNSVGYHHPANFHHWRESYFSTPTKRVANTGAVEFVKKLGSDVSVAAQNHILPHLASRTKIWRLGDYTHASVVVLSIDESAWPYSPSFPRQLARRLAQSSAWREVYEAQGTKVFIRNDSGLLKAQGSGES